MSMHYLIDPFTPSRDIIDVTKPEEGETNTTGALLIRVADGIPIHGKPKDLETLLTAKTDGLLAYYAGFSLITFDNCLTQGGVSLPDCSGVSVGAGVANHCIFPAGTLVTSTIDLLGVTPSACVVTWEAYSQYNVETSAGVRRMYVEEDSDLLECNVRFDGTTDTFVGGSGTVLNIPTDAQGDQLVLTFANTSGSRLYLGAWSVVY